ncbi:MAG: glutathione S-transferase family protein [Alphaproteobacteria bacterium]|jgi:glutathione S-transferase|nr:glutathione S-transferase family protein [Alphaproteobacteria bacterium]
MSKLRVYGYARSRTLRTLWMLEELGLPYDHVDLSSQAGGTRTPDFLKINPAGHIPAIDDDGFKLSESMAINLYLAKKHGKLQPATPQGEAKALQWSFWAAHEVDRQVVQWVINTTSLPVEQRNVKAAFAAREELEWPLQVLDGECGKHQYLADPDAFTVADLNVAAVLYRLLFVDLTGKPHLDQWLKRCWDRPAAKRARAMRE